MGSGRDVVAFLEERLAQVVESFVPKEAAAIFLDVLVENHGGSLVVAHVDGDARVDEFAVGGLLVAHAERSGGTGAADRRLEVGDLGFETGERRP